MKLTHAITGSKWHRDFVVPDAVLVVFVCHTLVIALLLSDYSILASKEMPVPSFFLKTTDLSAFPFFRSLTIARPHY